MITSVTTYAAPKKNLWPVWQKNNPESTATINHAAWQSFLKRYVDTNQEGVNLVRYAQVSKKDKRMLQNYIEQLSKINIDRYNRKEQLAYWVNLYNALTLETVLQRYPVKSILKINISPGFFSVGPWDAKLIRVKGKELTLNDIEHRIIRPIWNDPRTHYVLNCASYSCPNLRKTAFTGNNIDSTMNTAAHDYLNNPRGVNLSGNDLTLSKIFDWYRSDFGNNDQQVINHIKHYARPALKQKLNHIHKIDGYQYNWDLNGTPG